MTFHQLPADWDIISEYSWYKKLKIVLLSGISFIVRFIWKAYLVCVHIHFHIHRQRCITIRNIKDNFWQPTFLMFLNWDMNWTIITNLHFSLHRKTFQDGQVSLSTVPPGGKFHGPKGRGGNQRDLVYGTHIEPWGCQTKLGKEGNSVIWLTPHNDGHTLALYHISSVW